MTDESDDAPEKPGVDISKLADIVPEAPAPVRLKDLMGKQGGYPTGGLPNDLASGLANMQSRLGDIAGGLSGYSELEKKFKAQREQLAALSRPSLNIDQMFHDSKSHMKHLEARVPFKMQQMPPNPILETNKRLKQVEVSLEKMIAINANAAEIATDIQSHAANFLVKFERASHDTDKAARKAIWIGIFAIFIAVATPFIQSVVDFGKEQVYPDPTAPAIQALQEEVTRLKATETANTEKILAELVNGDPADAEKVARALREGNAETAKLLREITKLLAQQAKNLPAPPAK